MVRGSGLLLKCAGGINSTSLVCPLSKQPLRMCDKTNSLISDSIGVAYPILDGIPRLLPADGKIIDENSSSGSSKEMDTYKC